MSCASRIARYALLAALLAGASWSASGQEGRVFLRVPYASPSELIPHARDGSRVRHLSDGWALVEAPESSVGGSHSVVVGRVRPEYVYAWVAGPATSLAGVETVFVWRDYALVGAPRGSAERLDQAGLPHHAAPLGVVAERALTPRAAPDVRVSIGQLDIVLDRVVDAFDPDRWEASVRALSENDGTRSRYALRARNAMLFNGHPPPDDAADRAGDWIATQLASYGYSPLEHRFPYSLFTGGERAATFGLRNIIAEHPGVGGNREGTILVVAHYDTKASRTRDWETRWRDMWAPGADDNATGVATVLEVARLLADVPVARTVRFVLFSGEELGLIGSRHYADAMGRAGEDIMAVINIDMIGHDSDGRFDLHVVADPQSRWLLEAVESLRRAVESDIALVPQVNSDMTFSDHAPFWWEGYSGLFFAEETDFASDEFPAFYHTSGDTVDKIDLAYGTAAARLLCGIVAMLAAPAAAPGPSALPAPTEARVLAAAVFPNPFDVRSGTPLQLEYDLADAIEIRTEVYTEGGRRVSASAAAPDRPVTVWDGYTHEGTPAPPGLYFLRVEARDRTATPHLRTLRVLIAP